MSGELRRQEQPEETPEQNEPVLESQESEPQAEMPEDFEDPEGKAERWKAVKGEVEIEGKKS